MHDTLHPNIKGFLDNTITLTEFTIFKGWCFHIDSGVCPLRLNVDNNILEVDIKERNDVGIFYNNNRINNCGWKAIVPQNKTAHLQIQIDDIWSNVFKFNTNNVLDNSININNVSSNNLSNINVAFNNNKPSFIVSDNFYKNPDDIRNFALAQQFNHHKEYHKGKRTDNTFKFEGLKEQFEKLIGSNIKNWDHYGTNGVFQICIAGDQIVYHTDTQQYAAIIFLTQDAPPQSGTTFYRSKYTKHNKVSINEQNIVFKNGYLDSTYFDIVDVIGNVYNRIVLFDAQQIHSASTYFGNNDKNGRLFQIFFFDLE